MLGSNPRTYIGSKLYDRLSSAERALGFRGVFLSVEVWKCGSVEGRWSAAEVDGFWESHTPPQSCKGRARANIGKTQVLRRQKTYTMLHHRLMTMTLADKSNICSSRRFGFLLASLLLVSSPADGQGGFGNFIHNLFRPIMRLVQLL